MKSELLRAGKFLCLVGHDNQLSLTNLSLMVVLGRLCFSDAPGLTEVLPFLITVVGYQTKRWQYGKAGASEFSAQMDLADSQPPVRTYDYRGVVPPSIP